MTQLSITPRRLALLGAVAVAGALPATALAKHGADDGVSTTTQSTISTTTGSTTTGSTTTGATTTPAPAGSTRAKAVAAAKAAVREQTRLLRVKRKSDGRWEVRLAGASTRYTVRLDRDLDVLRVRREALRPAGAGSDDGTADQGSGDAPGTPSSGGGSSSDDSGHHSGDDDSGHHGGRGSDADGGHHGGHGSDD